MIITKDDREIELMTEAGRIVALVHEKLKEVIPRQLFAIHIKAVIGGKILERETMKARREDVLAKC